MHIVTERDARHRLLWLVAQVKSEMQLAKPPQYCGIHDPVAKHLRIKVEEQVGLWGDGTYVPENPPRIVIDPTKGDQERLNFTFFHEVSHHLIREDDELYGFLDDHSPQDLHPALERYCNMGAAEFLVPESDVLQLIREQGFHIELISELDTIFSASKPAIAIQLAQCAQHQCIIVVCEYGKIPRRNQAQIPIRGAIKSTQQQLFVQYVSSSPSCKYKTGRFVPVPREHLITTAYQTQSLVKGRGNIPVRSGKIWPSDCEAFFYKGKVYGVFNLTPPPQSNQKAFSF